MASWSTCSTYWPACRNASCLPSSASQRKVLRDAVNERRFDGPSDRSSRVSRWLDPIRDRLGRDVICASPPIDPLTGFEWLQDHVTIRPGSVLAMVELVDLKAVNDTYGHAMGDTVLRVVGGRLRDRIAPGRWFRLGGNVFVLAVDGPLDGADAARLARRIADAAAIPIDGILDPVEVNIGLSLRQVSDDLSVALVEVDRAMYEARAAGLPFHIASAEPIGRPTLPEPDAPRRARLSLEGLALGDAFGERFFVGDDSKAAELIEARQLPDGLWRWTDDTALAIPIVRELQHKGYVDPRRVAQRFAQTYLREPARGYGRGTHQVLGSLAAGVHWSVANRTAFADGSRGNGAAMRSAPVGAYFAGRTAKVSRCARRSALPTHAHPEAVDGAIAVALAASYAATTDGGYRRGGLLEAVIDAAPTGGIRVAIMRAFELLDVSPTEAAAILGSGQRVLAEDTVPFALWCADRHLDSFEDAMWATVSGLGDRDTTCAMVGGIVALSCLTGLPETWLAHREDLPAIVRLGPVSHV